ncbi:hypothetical protein AGMMS4956_02970 [Bacteroidia bacterium]|nr:hypothetical protein AGMMS4956_02970 [Bacteroidia bacterium]
MKNTLLPIFLLLASIAAAQETTQEISVYGTGGLSTLQYKSAQGKVSLGIGGGGGVGYTFFFNPQWGFNIGVEVALFNASASGAAITGSSKEIYDYGRIEDTYFNSTYSDYKEKQRAVYLQVPLMAQFQTGADNKFYAAAGVKVGIALAGSYATTANQLVLSGYFPATEQTFADVPEVGYVSKEHPTTSGELDFGFNLSLAAEVGARWRLSGYISLYTGLYVDYGLLNVAPKKTTALVHRPSENLTAFAYNSLLTATLPAGNYVDKINLFSAGLKVKLSFAINHSNTPPKSKNMKFENEA